MSICFGLKYFARRLKLNAVYNRAIVNGFKSSEIKQNFHCGIVVRIDVVAYGK